MFLQSLGLDLAILCLYHVNSNGYAKCYQNILKGIGPVSLFLEFVVTRQNLDQSQMSFDNLIGFSEFEPRQKLNQSQMSFDNLMGYILSISMFMQTFITIFHSVQEIAPLLLFQNLELGEASTNPKCHLTISLATSCQYQCVCKIPSQYSSQFKR